MSGRALEGRVALVTGAGSGIGRAVCARLAEAGARVAVTSRSLDHVRQTCADVERFGEALGVKLDVSDTASIARAVESITDELGGIDIVANNAGLGTPHLPTLGETTTEEWDALFHVNVRGMFLVCKETLPHLHPGASIVNIASINAFVGADRHAAYVATKGAVMQLTRALAIELAPTGVRVNAVCPGVIDTPLTDRYLQQTEDAGALRASMERMSPLGRLGTPREVANCVAFLASDDASFVTGSALIVDGGATA